MRARAEKRVRWGPLRSEREEVAWLTAGLRRQREKVRGALVGGRADVRAPPAVRGEEGTGSGLRVKQEWARYEVDGPIRFLDPFSFL